MKRKRNISLDDLQDMKISIMNGESSLHDEAVIIWAIARIKKLEAALEAAKLTEHGIGESSFSDSGGFYGLCSEDQSWGCDCGMLEHNQAIDNALENE